MAINFEHKTNKEREKDRKSLKPRERLTATVALRLQV